MSMTSGRHLVIFISVSELTSYEIAKPRTEISAQIVKNCGGDEEAQKINLYVSTSTFCQTKYDPA